MLRVGRVFERNCVSVFRAFGSGPVPPNSKYVKPKPGAGQKEGLEEKSKRLMDSIAGLKAQSDKRAEIEEDKMAQIVESNISRKDVSVQTNQGFEIRVVADSSALHRHEHIHDNVQTRPFPAIKTQILVTQAHQRR